MDDLDTDEAWQIRQRAQAALDSIEETLARRAERRAAGVGGSTWSPPQPPPRRAAAPSPPPRARAAPSPPAPTKVVRTTRAENGDLSASIYEGDAGVAALGWEKWINDAINRKITALVDKGLVPLAEEVGTSLATAEKRIAEQEARLAKSEEAVTQLLMDLERRLVAVEGLVAQLLSTLNGPAQRAMPKPRLVEGPDAA
jgi:hypothetical protein